MHENLNPKYFLHVSIILVPHYSRLLTGYYAQDSGGSVLLMNKHLIIDATQDPLFRPEDPCITNDGNTEPYLLDHLDNIKLFTSLCVATSITN